MARKKNTETALILPSPEVIEKAVVSVPAPGRVRFSVVGAQGNTVTEATALTRRQNYGIYYEMYRQHPTIRAAIEKIAKVAVSNGLGFKPENPDELLNKDHAKELRTFNRASNMVQLLRLTYKDILIYGNAYWWIERARNGKPVRAVRLHPRYVTILTDGTTVTGYRYGQDGPTEDARTYDPANVVHFKLDDPDSDLYGMSLLESLQAVVAVDLFALKFNGKFFENSAQTGVIFALKSTDAGEVERNREYLEQNYVGTDNAHKPILLEGDIDVKQSVSKMQEMQFLEGRKFNREEMLSVLDVHPDKLGILEDVNRSSSKESDESFRTEAITPLQGVVEEEYNNRIVLEMFGWDDILFAHNEVSKRDSIDKMKLLSEAERMGVMSVNEIRAEQFGLGPIDGGDVHFIQTAAGTFPLDLLVKMAEAQIAMSESSAEASEASAKATLHPPKDPNASGGAAQARPAVRPRLTRDPAAPALGSLRDR